MTHDATPPENAVSTNDARPRPIAARTEKTREDRLKAALKANMARRKAQARARSAPNNNEKE